MDLSERVLPYNNEKNNEILVTIGDKFNNEDYRHLQQLSQILNMKDIEKIFYFYILQIQGNYFQKQQVGFIIKSLKI